MKIAFISQNFYPEQFSNNAIARNLHDQGDDVEVLTAVPNYPKGVFFDGYSNQSQRQETWNGIHIQRVLTWPRKSGALNLLLNYMGFMIFGIWRALWTRAPRPDVIFVSQLSPVLMCLPGVILKWRYKAPLVYWVQDIWPESALYTLKLKNPLIVKPLTWLCGWIYRRADLVLVQSAAFPPMIERFGVPADKIRVFPNTAPDSYRPLPRDSDSFAGKMMPKTGFNLVFAGNIGESQDFDTYIEAAHLLRHRDDLNWVIIGSGRDMDRVQQVIADRGLADTFQFLGRHAEDEMPDFFSHADAMLVGLKDNAIFRLTVPYKVQCYMACGKPIIASLNGEGARVINDAQAGVVAPAQSPKSLAKAIERFLDMPHENRAKCGQSALEYFQREYSADVVYRNLNKWLIEVSDQ